MVNKKRDPRALNALKADTPASAQIQMRVTPERKERYIAQAQREGKKLSEWILSQLDKMTVNSHELFNTIEHEHIGNGEVELNLVGCADSRWFVENPWNDKRFSAIAGISNPGIEPYMQPTFFASEDKAREFAIKSIQTVLPDFQYE